MSTEAKKTNCSTTSRVLSPVQQAKKEILAHCADINLYYENSYDNVIIKDSKCNKEKLQPQLPSNSIFIMMTKQTNKIDR